MVDYLPIHDSADNVGRAQGPTEPLAFGAAWLAARLHRVTPRSTIKPTKTNHEKSCQRHEAQASI
jgi:hypothetical protein